MLVTHKGQRVDKNWLLYFFKTTPLVSSFVLFFFSPVWYLDIFIFNCY